MSEFMEIRQVRVAVIHADRLTDMTKLIDYFRDLCEEALNRVPALLLCSCLVQFALFNGNINVSLFTFDIEPIT